MLEYIDNFKFELRSPLRPNESTLDLCPEAVKMLNTVEKGNHVYLSLHWLDKYEIVKFTKDEDLKLSVPVLVERDVETKGSKNFPRGSCVKVQWNKITMDEYVAQRGV